MDDAPPPAEERRQSLLGSLATKFATLYFAMAVLDQDHGAGPLGPLVDAMGRAFLGLPGGVPNEESGSGDRLYDWLAVPAMAAVALALTAAWAALDRRRRHDRTIQEALRVVLRYGLGLMIVSYGLAKVSQFPMPGVLRFAEPLGRTTPMGLLWTFMGYSVPYSLFAGALEILGGLLLLFRRTALLGTTVFAAVMLNVFALNLCYDVPVKLYTFQCLVAAAILLAPDARRLIDLFVLNRPVAPRELGPPVRYRRLRVGVLVVKWVVLGNLLAGGARAAYETWAHRRREASALDGVWVAQGDVLNRGDWLQLEVGDGYVRLRAWGRPDAVGRLHDDGRGAFRFKGRTGPEHVGRYRLQAGLLSVEEGAKRYRLRRDDAYPLARHPFHWVQESVRTP